jgi:hypothetical protein
MRAHSSGHRLASCGATLLVAALLALATVAGAEQRAPLAGVALEDPDGRSWDLAALAGRPVLVVVADGDAADEAAAWGKAINDACRDCLAHWVEPGRLTVLSVADLRSVPSFARGTARWMISKMGDDEPVVGPPRLLDWEGAVAGPIGAREGVPNVRLFDASGALVVEASGDATPAEVARVNSAIERLFPAKAGEPAGPTPAAPEPARAESAP